MNTCFLIFRATSYHDFPTVTSAILFFAIINVHQWSSKLFFEFFSMIILLHFFLLWIEVILVEKKLGKVAIWVFLDIFFKDLTVDFGVYQSCLFRARVHFSDRSCVCIWKSSWNENLRADLNIIKLKVPQLKGFLQHFCIRFKKLILARHTRPRIFGWR